MHSKRYYFIFICQLFTCLTFINIFQMDSELINDTIILISTFLFTYVFENVYSFLAFLPITNQSEFLKSAEMQFIRLNNSGFILIILILYIYKAFSPKELTNMFYIASHSFFNYILIAFVIILYSTLEIVYRYLDKKNN